MSYLTDTAHNVFFDRLFRQKIPVLFEIATDIAVYATEIFQINSGAGADPQSPSWLGLTGQCRSVEKFRRFSCASSRSGEKYIEDPVEYADNLVHL